MLGYTELIQQLEKDRIRQQVEIDRQSRVVSDKDRDELRTVLRMLVLGEFTGIGDEMLDNALSDLLKVLGLE